ncbi:MAG: shikimate dehydrogenase [Bacteroidetes bacterium]|nr:shikimate dehydrogenase [Bacteroidota bacterium]
MEKIDFHRYGLIGKGLSHSFSPGYFARKFAAMGLPHRYELFDLPAIEDFTALPASIPGLAGLNVTIPYKEVILPYLQSLSAEAQVIGAVNTIACLPGGKLAGHNTDWLGFQQSLAETFHPRESYRALVLGTGGASKAVVYALQQETLCREVSLVSRRATGNTLSYEALTPRLLADYTLIINTTPLGMHPATDDCPPLPWRGSHAAQHYYDLIYNPARTLFLQRARMAGAGTQNGLRMLELQADTAWAIWQQYPPGE